MLKASVSLAIFALSLHAQNGSPQKHMVFNSQVVVGAGKYYRISVTVPVQYVRARLAGSVTASGGTGNDIRVLVTKDSTVVFDSGKSRSVVLSVDCAEPGAYTVLFDNRFSLASSKIVAGSLHIVEWGLDEERTQELREKNVARSRLASELLATLWENLTRDEREWGTSQLSVVPRVVLVSDVMPNAAAFLAQNTIRVNGGLFDFADRFGDASKDLVAGVLAHELSHLYYHHRDESHPGSLLDELLGKTSLDRQQERQADILGLAIACQAGFDPNGLVFFMEKLNQSTNGKNSSFASNHPPPVERLAYLKVEADVCEKMRRSNAQLSAAENVTDLPASTTSSTPPTWLDSTPRNWNKPGASIPTAPKTAGQLPANCAATLATPESNEELALSRAGWSLQGTKRIGLVAVVTGALGFDGMCRPVDYQMFVFAEGKFAGTLSPNLMSSRLDGSAIKVSLNGNQDPIVDFARYQLSDPLCCPSRVSTAEYEILFESGHPVVEFKKVRTRAGQR